VHAKQPRPSYLRGCELHFHNIAALASQADLTSCRLMVAHDFDGVDQAGKRWLAAAFHVHSAPKWGQDAATYMDVIGSSNWLVVRKSPSGRRIRLVQRRCHGNRWGCGWRTSRDLGWLRGLPGNGSYDNDGNCRRHASRGACHAIEGAPFTRNLNGLQLRFVWLTPHSHF
jgi:hypothetical protein